MKKGLRKRALGLVFLSTLLFANSSSAATEHFVSIDNSFVPSHLQIEFGDTVTWINDDPFFSHTVKSTSTPAAWQTGFLFDEGSTFSLIFNALGSFPYRDDGSFATGNITVVSGNSPPSVTITNPVPDATFTAPATFFFRASASDSDGTVANVQFFVNTNSVGTDTTANPYSATVSNLGAGSHVLSAVATDNSGAKTTNSISITVMNPIISLSDFKISGSQFRFTISGLLTGKTNFVQASTNLVDWTSVRTNIASGSASNYTNTQPASVSPKFFRILQLQ